LVGTRVIGDGGLGSQGCEIWLYQVTTGKQISQVRTPKDTYISQLAISPDGRNLAVLSSNSVSLLEAATGKERYRYFTYTKQVRASFSKLVFTPDGRTLIAAGSYGTPIYFWDVASAKELGRRQGEQTDVTSLALSADGRTLLAGGADGTALVWDCAKLTQRDRLPPLDLKAEQVASLWTDLADADAGKAFRGVQTLAASPRQVVPFLGQRLMPVSGLDRQRVEKLIADLESKQFAVREAASNELEKFGELAEFFLRKALEGKPSLDLRQRVEQLLTKIQYGILSGEELRAWRAMEVLEHLGSAEAKQVLEKLARGAPGHRITEEAKASLARLTER
jgi:hypothetical protein